MDRSGTAWIVSIYLTVSIAACYAEFFLVLPILAAPVALAWIFLYTGRLVITDTEIRWRRCLLWPERAMRVDEIRHIVRRTPWISTSWQDRITLVDDAGRRIRLPARLSDPFRVERWVTETARWIVQRKRVEEARDGLRTTFRCPGPRWLAHVFAGGGALAGAGIAVAFVSFILSIPEAPETQVVVGLFGTGLLGLFVWGLQSGSWVGAELILSQGGVELRRVTSHRKWAWTAIRRVWQDPSKRIVIELGESTTIRLPEGIEDRELVPLFLDVGQRRALSRES